jgi:hypothetical protein
VRQALLWLVKEFTEKESRRKQRFIRMHMPFIESGKNGSSYAKKLAHQHRVENRF